MDDPQQPLQPRPPRSPGQHFSSLRSHRRWQSLMAIVIGASGLVVGQIAFAHPCVGAFVGALIGAALGLALDRRAR